MHDPSLDRRSLLTLFPSTSSAKLELHHEADQIVLVFDFKDGNKGAGGMVLRISYKEIEEIVSSKVIMMEGVLLSANTIKAVGVDGKWRKWYLWNQPRPILEI
jgi:hypothetical protein